VGTPNLLAPVDDPSGRTPRITLKIHFTVPLRSIIRGIVAANSTSRWS
jgi:hypothetical protein